ncbi:ATP-binding protein [Vibrio spartinae]|uniref:histidine kinase n=1 Tax=Vibrio spartinae TaxID=1918945 RepID=A0A1N6M606_9VIBR|nr:ATP-binding protein [Vibrio spartinae]QMV14841.1 Sensor protein RstB [Vibrio spartinae]SIO94881.1 Sensor protein RstB [Vibrio spartinae]
MIKSFLGLWILVFGPLFFLLYPSDLNPILSFNNYIEGQRYERIYQGTFTLIESRLDTIPIDTWPDEIEQLSQHFGYALQLLDINQTNLGTLKRDEIEQHQIIFFNEEPEFLIKKIGNSHFILKIFVDSSEEEKIRRGAEGTVYLLQEQFAATEQEHWPALLRSMANYFPFDLQIASRNQINISQTEQNQLATDSFFWRTNLNDEITFYIRLSDGASFLLANLIPMSSIHPSVIIVLVLVFVLSISAGMFFWTYPLWRDLKNLLAATSRFGSGDLNSRALVYKISTVATLGKAFNHMADRIEQLLKGQRTLTNAIAHDLRTPLYRLRFAFEMLANAKTDREKEKYQQSISKSLEDLDSLINQTMVLSRYSGDSQLLSFAKYHLAQLLDDECSSVVQLYPDIHYQLQIAPEASGKLALIDQIAMKRAISNLFINACKYARTTVVVRLSFVSETDMFVIDVCDDGIGIDESDWERIFLPFEQLDNARSHAASGHGLGLAIVKHIAQWHQGTVCAGRSDLGGARFTFTFPSRT